MRKLVLSLVAVLALAVASPAAAATVTVAITKTGFVPNPVSIKQGDTVTWTNADTVNRQVVSQQGGFASPVLRPGESYSFTFRNPGRFTYQDPLVKPADRGTVNVAEAPASVAIAASRTIVVYGGSVRLSGTISSGQPNETVQLLVQQFRETTSTRTATLTTGPGGAWSVVVKPTIQTTYQVRWKNVTSAPATIRVRPRVGLSVLSSRPAVFRTKVTSAISYAGKLVYLQRRNALGRWVSIKRVRLNSLSAATFRATLPRGLSRVRVFIPQTQAGPGYLAGWSAVRLVRR